MKKKRDSFDDFPCDFPCAPPKMWETMEKLSRDKSKTLKELAKKIGFPIQSFGIGKTEKIGGKK